MSIFWNKVGRDEIEGKRMSMKIMFIENLMFEPLLSFELSFFEGVESFIELTLLYHVLHV